MIEATRIRKLPGTIPYAKRYSTEYKLVIYLVLIHLPLGVLMFRFGYLGLVHQAGVILAGLYYAAQDKVKLERVAIIAAYIVASEILWRMAYVSIYWEIGKYASSLIFLVALLRSKRHRIPFLPIIYFLALVPASLMTLSEHGFELAKDVLSSNMSGPLCLAMSCIFFANIKLTKEAVRRLVIALLLPLLSVGVTTLFYTVTAENIEFTQESNFLTSGNFGPNQVSAMLGCGAFAAMLLLVAFRNSGKATFLLLVATIFLAAQSVMTFSRGGMYAAVGAIAVASITLLADPGAAVRRLAPILLSSLIFLGLVFPFLDSYTGGALGERFEDIEGTNTRTEIAGADLNIFLENPIFGAGVGGAYELRERYLDRKAMSHTEFTRLLSEHGILGIMAAVALLLIALLNFSRQKTVFGKAFVIGTTCWAVLFMLNAGMRLAAPSYIFGLGSITFVSLRSARRVVKRRRRMIRRVPSSIVPESDE